MLLVTGFEGKTDCKRLRWKQSSYCCKPCGMSGSYLGEDALAPCKADTIIFDDSE